MCGQCDVINLKRTYTHFHIVYFYFEVIPADEKEDFQNKKAPSAESLSVLSVGHHPPECHGADPL